MTERYFGKYRGIVANNVDPQSEGRIQAIVPDVSGPIPGSWATACVPMSGKLSGTWFVPEVGAPVWIEYEQGDPDHPIWTGCFWNDSTVVPSGAKSSLPVSPTIVLQSGAKTSIVINSMPGVGGITLQITSGAKIVINDIGITIDNGKGATLELTATSVMINKTALVVQ